MNYHTISFPYLVIRFETCQSDVPTTQSTPSPTKVFYSFLTCPFRQVIFSGTLVPLSVTGPSSGRYFGVRPPRLSSLVSPTDTVTSPKTRSRPHRPRVHLDTVDRPRFPSKSVVNRCPRTVIRYSPDRSDPKLPSEVRNEDLPHSRPLFLFPLGVRTVLTRRPVPQFRYGIRGVPQSWIPQVPSSCFILKAVILTSSLNPHLDCHLDRRKPGI